MENKNLWNFIEFSYICNRYEEVGREFFRCEFERYRYYFKIIFRGSIVLFEVSMKIIGLIKSRIWICLLKKKRDFYCLIENGWEI